jgi:Carboxypeptidase regulatory-like domain/TonB dependent receptor
VTTITRLRVNLWTLGILLAAFFIGLYGGELRAQTTNASVTGYITDQTKAVIVGAKVIVINVDTNGRYEAATNGVGSYDVPNLPPGRYRIEVEKPGFKTVVKSDLILHVQDTAAINFEMAVGSASEIVTVEAGGLVINTTDATVATVIDRNFAENLPLNGRSFQTLLLLTPGTVLDGTGSNGGTFSVNGQRENANNFTVDGVSANVAGSAPGQLNGANPNFTIAGTTQGMVSVDALQEFKIQTSTYAPEFGRQPGGQISLLTRSGTNGFHGTAFDYLRNDALDANNWFNDATIDPTTGMNLPKGKERQNDFGGTIGGPIFKDKTFFFFSYEGLRLLQPQTAVTQVPSLRLRQEAAPSYQQILNSWPIPEGPELTAIDPTSGLLVPTGAANYTLSQSFPTNLDSYSIKIDEVLTKRIHLIGRYTQTTSDSEVPNQAPNNNETDKIVSRALTLGTDFSLQNNVENELRLNYSVTASSRTFSLNIVGGAQAYNPSQLYPAPILSGKDNGIVLMVLPNAPVFQTTAGPYGKISQRQINLVDNLFYSHGSHQIKWGIDYRRLFPIFGQVPLVAGYFVTAESDVVSGNVSFANVTGNFVAHPIYTSFSAYTQDTWKASNRLTLTYGLRWESNLPPGERDGIQPLNVVGLSNPTTAALAPLNSALYNTTYNNFAPRVGVAYQLRQAQGRETVIRGGFGVFYDLGSEAAALGFASAPFQDKSANLTNLPNSNTPIPFPVPANVLPAPPAPGLPTPPLTVNAVDPNLRLPYTLQWNLSVEQALGPNQSLTASYVASLGQRLLRSDNLFDFNPNFALVTVVRNASDSSYHSLQLQLNRRLSSGLQALASYTYSHSIDNASDGQVVLSGSPTGDGFLNPNIDRSSSSTDVRNAFRGAITYNIPTWNANVFSKVALGGWSVNTIGIAQTSLPVDLIGGFYSPSAKPDAFFGLRPNVVSGQPLYLHGAACASANGGTPCPGGMGFNPAAFTSVPTDSNGNPTQVQGTLGRNVMCGFGALQLDFALQRQFSVTERIKLQFRSELFNVFNHPNFGRINRFTPGGNLVATSTLNNSLGGLNSLYGIGGPRSIQLALKLSF